jgi:hypothetical protein
MLQLWNMQFRPRVLAFFALVCACGSEPITEPSASANSVDSAVSSASVAPPSASAVVDESAAHAGRGDGSGGGQKGKRFGEAFAYVDGKPVGVLRYFELPPGLEPHDHTLLDGRKVPRYRVAEYLESLGVDLAKMKEVHFIGGRNRAAKLAASEIVKHRKDLTFSFTRGAGGKARVHWPASGIEVNTTIDVIVAMSAFVALDPPKFDAQKRRYVNEDGSKIDGIPYAKPEESLRGTRVYLDGALLGAVKRKRLPDSTLSPRYDPKTPRFSLDSYLKWVGADPTKVREIDLLQGDRVVARVAASDWAKARNTAEFSLSPGSEGRIIVHLPEGSGESSLSASAMQVFQTKPAPTKLAKAKVEASTDGSTSPQDRNQDSAE